LLHTTQAAIDSTHLRAYISESITQHTLFLTLSPASDWLR